MAATTTTTITATAIETTTETTAETELITEVETEIIELKTIEEVAKEVLDGKWGNGDERKERLVAAGYNYDEVQLKVEELKPEVYSSSIIDLEGYQGNQVKVGTFEGTWYHTYGKSSNGGSGRRLISCNTTENIKGSIASATLYRNYEYNYNGSRTTVYLSFPDNYSSMNGYYYVDDCCRDSWVIDFYYLGYNNSCPFRGAGRIYNIQCWIVS